MNREHALNARAQRPGRLGSVAASVDLVVRISRPGLPIRQLAGRAQTHVQMLALLPLHTGDTGRHNRNRGDFQLEPEIEAGYVAQEIARQARSHPKKHDKLRFFGRRNPKTTMARRQGRGSDLERGCEKMSFESKEDLRAAIENTDCETLLAKFDVSGVKDFSSLVGRLPPSALSQCDAGHASHPTVASPGLLCGSSSIWTTSTATSPNGTRVR